MSHKRRHFVSGFRGPLSKFSSVPDTPRFSEADSSPDNPVIPALADGRSGDDDVTVTSSAGIPEIQCVSKIFELRSVDVLASVSVGPLSAQTKRQFN